MTDEERARIQARILSTAPAHTGAEKFSGPVRRKNPFGFSALFGILVAIVLVVGAGFMTAAQGALPGDGLYPMKVGFVEPLRTSFAGTGERLAALQSGLVNTRLDEAETLATAGELNDAKRQEIEQLLDRHTVALDQALQTLETESPQKVSALTTALQASLAFHTKLLDQFIAFASTTATSSTKAASRMHMSAEAAARLKAQTDMHISNPRALWTLPLPTTTTSDFILKNMKGSDMSAAVINGSEATTSPDKLPLDDINKANPKANQNVIKKRLN